MCAKANDERRQRVIHGPGDVEGTRITYEQADDGRWVPVSGVADDGFHDDVELSPVDFVDGQGRVVLTTSVWSHQLGTRGSARVAQAGNTVCFGGDSLAPLTDEIVNAFRLGSPADPRRAPPAWKLEASKGTPSQGRTIAGLPFPRPDVKSPATNTNQTFQTSIAGDK